jgi:hypothetical protein
MKGYKKFLSIYERKQKNGRLTYYGYTRMAWWAEKFILDEKNELHTESCICSIKRFDNFATCRLQLRCSFIKMLRENRRMESMKTSYIKKIWP